LTWAEAFAIYRGAVIIQGIAARYAARQASSEKAMDHGNAMRPHAEMAWQFVQEVERQGREDGIKGSDGELSEQEKASGRGYMAKL